MEFDQNDGRCFGCHQTFNGDKVVWLAESDRDVAWPFHSRCAEGPWPLSPIDGPQPWAHQPPNN